MTNAQWYINRLFFMCNFGGGGLDITPHLYDWVWDIAFDAYTEPGY